MDKPEVDYIEGLSPSISIEQKSTSHNPRSTVGTITEIYDYLRLLFARVGEARCPTHGHPLAAQTVSEIVDQVMALEEGTRVMLLAPIVAEKKGSHEHTLADLRRDGFIRARINGIVVDLDNAPLLDKNKRHTIETVIDRFVIRDSNQSRIADSVEISLNLGEGRAILAPLSEDKASAEHLFSSNYSCPECGYAIAALEPRMFSFNSPHGACRECDGLGFEQQFSPDLIVDEELTLAEGAIRGWDSSKTWYWSTFQKLSDHFKFPLDEPYRKLADEAKDVLLYGSNGESIDMSFRLKGGSYIKRFQPWQGVIPWMQHRLRETNSRGVHEYLSRFMHSTSCSACQGTRLGLEPRNVFIDDRNIAQVTELSIEGALEYFKALTLGGQREVIAQKILEDIVARLTFLVNVGLNYLTLDRVARSLSGGEAQRIRLASQIGAGLVGVLYILDEPSIGLHQRDNRRLLSTLEHLRDIGNTVIVVEHDEEAMHTANQIIDLGPGAGVHGGSIVAQGTIDKIKKSAKSITGQYLSGKRCIEVPVRRNEYNPDKVVVINGAKGNNLKNVQAEIPLGLFTCITGVSGSGKSTLINQTLYPIASTILNKAQNFGAKSYEDIHGLEHLDKIVDIDQSPIGRTPRSNPATYTDVFKHIRDLFARTQESRARGYKPGRFSFNVKGGRCEACAGDGLIKVEMHFLPDVYVKCDACDGRRYNRETLEVTYKNKNIHEVLDMTVEEALSFFKPVPPIRSKLQTLMDVGLSYIKLGQSATTLSGGEAQRVKLAKELSRRSTGKTLYILDEPTTGLHFLDIQHLLNVLHRLRDAGNTVVVIEHNMDVIKTADWIIDLGPEGGSDGGEIIATGSPENVAMEPKSYTGQYLQRHLAYN